MEKRVRLFVQSTLILLTLGISVQVSAQPEVVTRVPFNSENFITIGELVYFTAGGELWRTDGTASGTMALQGEFDQGHQWGMPLFGREFKGDFYFVDNNRNELWKSDGTPSGTIRLHTSGGNNNARIIGPTNDYLFFQAYDAATGLELYRTNGTPAGTMLVKDINPGPDNGFVGFAAAVGNYLFFAANNGTEGQELWNSDGSSWGTVMVKDINPGAADGFGNWVTVLGYNNLFYFGGNTPESGMEPWVSDGTAEGTYLLQDIVAGAESPVRLDYRIAHDGMVSFLVYFRDDFGSIELWSSGGTMASTSMIKTIGYDPNLIHSFLVYQDKVYFWNYNEPDNYLWVTDGTTEGTEVIFSTTTGEDTFHYFDVVNNHMLFAGTAESYPTSFYRSDGTPAGTEPFAEFKSALSPPERRDLTTVNDFAFYADHDGPVDEGRNPVNEADYFHLFQADGFTTQSMRTMYGISTMGTDNIVNFNGKVIFTTFNDISGQTGDPRYLWIYDPAHPSETRASFTLVDSDTDEDIQTINEGDVITKAESSNINIRYNPVETPESVTFSINGVKVRTENVPPYSLAGDINGDYAAWNDANPGSYTLTATPYSESGGNGTAGTPLTVNFTIEEESPSGTILREYWEGVPGSRVSHIPVHTAPTQTSQLSIFEGPTNAGTHYGARIKGYVYPPATGGYVFWIASNDHSELWLSTDENPNNKVRIAYVKGATRPRQWTKFPSQKSAAISLTAGKRYYIEVLHKQAGGTDNLAVGWQLPDGTQERPIPESRLSPADAMENSVPVLYIGNPRDGQTFNSSTNISSEDATSDGKALYSEISIYPNPAKSGDAELTISGYESIDETIETEVEIINLTGEVVHNQRIRCGGDCSVYLMNINQQLVRGVFMVNMKTNGTRSSKRLLVK